MENSDGLLCRLADRRDIAIIAEFNRRIAWETEQKNLDLQTVNLGVTRVFDDPNKGFYLVAELENEIVGQLMVTYEWSDWRDGFFWWIQSVYVRDDQRRKGIFRKLFQQVVDQATSSGDVVGIRLYVERDNRTAQATYHGLGMHDSGYLVEELMLK